MYSLEYLPIARRDLVEAVSYISHDLGSPEAALRLAEEVERAGERLQQFPYAWPVYQASRPLERDYRKLLVENFFLFYWVDEQRRLVTVARVIYARRDYGKLLQ